MKQYLTLLHEVLDHGVVQANRTGINTRTLPGAMLKFDLRHGFPAMTTKRLAFAQVKGELMGFLTGVTSAADFRALGCNIWDQNANENKAWLANPNRFYPDHLGRIYGAQWRRWCGTTVNGVEVTIDQLRDALQTLRTDPTSRRIIVNAWNAAELDQAALPPCHLLFQLLPHIDDKVLHMVMYMRSCDMFLGVPFNIASYALLLELFAAWSGYTAGTLTMFLADVHIYENHLGQVREQLSREPLALPRLSLGAALPEGCEDMHLDDILDEMLISSIDLLNYQSHPSIKASMAV